DSGDFVRLDRKGELVSRLAIGPDAAQVVVDRAARVAFVADRSNDKIVVVDLASAELTVKARWATPAEPFGLALSPDSGTLLVTTVADRTLVAYDTRDGSPRWMRPLRPEPRGVAISP